MNDIPSTENAETGSPPAGAQDGSTERTFIGWQRLLVLPTDSGGTIKRTGGLLQVFDNEGKLVATLTENYFVRIYRAAREEMREEAARVCAERANFTPSWKDRELFEIAAAAIRALP